MDKLQAIKDRINKVSDFEWLAGSFKSQDIYWLIQTVEDQNTEINQLKSKCRFQKYLKTEAENLQLAEENERLKIVEQAYEAYKKAK